MKVIRRVALRPLKVRWWVAFILIIAFIRVGLVLAIFPNQAIAPDENIYSFLLTSLVAGEDMGWASYYIGFGPTMVTGSLLLLGQGYPFALLGLGSMDALRLASILFDVLAKLLIVSVVVYAMRSRADLRRFKGIALASAPGAALLFLILMPSVQLWTSLGLRDASAIFSMVVAAWGFFLLISARNIHGEVVACLPLLAGVMGLHFSRSHVALPLVVSLIVALVWLPVRHRRRSIALGLASLALGSFLGSTIRDNAPEQPPNSEPRVEYLMTPPSDEPQFATSVQGEVTIPGGPAPFQVGRNLYVTRENMRVGADSAFETNYCATAWVQLHTAALCEARHLPTGVSRFLLSPNLIVTGVSVAPSRLFAGVENIAWLLIFVLALITVAGRISLSSRLTLFLSVFLVLTSVAYGLASGNEGTAFRHKGQFLWAWCLVIALGYGWRPWVRSLVQWKQPVS